MNTSRRLKNLFSFAGAAAALLAFLIGIVHAFLGLWFLLVADALVLALGVSVFIADVLQTLWQFKTELYRVVYLHRWGN
jgi:hypothetical protein